MIIHLSTQPTEFIYYSKVAQEYFIEFCWLFSEIFFGINAVPTYIHIVGQQ